jgi:hypothetical protein
MSRRAVSPIGLTRSLRRYPWTTKPKFCSPETRHRGSHATTRAHTLQCGPNPLSSFDSTHRVSPVCHRNRSHRPFSRRLRLPLPRFIPLQRFSSRTEPLTSAAIPRRRLRCALRVSHPLDALLPARPTELVSSRTRSWGFPPRLCSPRDAVRPFERRAPPGFDPHPL